MADNVVDIEVCLVRRDESTVSLGVAQDVDPFDTSVALIRDIITNELDDAPDHFRFRVQNKLMRQAREARLPVSMCMTDGRLYIVRVKQKQPPPPPPLPPSHDHDDSSSSDDDDDDDGKKTPAPAASDTRDRDTKEATTTAAAMHAGHAAGTHEHDDDDDDAAERKVRELIKNRRRSTIRGEAPESVFPRSVALKMVARFRKHMCRHFGTGYATSSHAMSFKQFASVFPVDSRFIAHTLFRWFANDAQKAVVSNVSARVEVLLLQGEYDDFVAFAFHLHDEDGDGRLTLVEVQRMLSGELDYLGIELDPATVKALASDLFDDLDTTNNTWFVDLQSFRVAMRDKAPFVRGLVKLALSWLPQDRDSDGDDGDDDGQRRDLPLMVRVYRRCHQRNFALAFKSGFALLLTLVAAVALGAHVDTDEGVRWDDVGFVGGVLASTLMMFVMISGCRSLLLHLQHGVTGWVSMNDCARFHHVLVAPVMMVMVVVHALAYIAHAATNSVDEPPSYSAREQLFTSRTHYDTKYAGTTGCISFALMCIVAAMPLIARRSSVATAWSVHSLSYVMLFMLAVHSSHFWKFMLLPLFFLAVEVATRRMTTYTRSEITRWRRDELSLELVLRRPTFFHFEVGQHVLVKVAEVSEHEWVPVPIASRPEKAGELVIRVQASLQWARQLQDTLEHIAASSVATQSSPSSPSSRRGRRDSLLMVDGGGGGRSITATSSSTTTTTTSDDGVRRVPIIVDGPYGRTTNDIYKAEHAMVMAYGAAATASLVAVMESIWHRHRARMVKCAKCRHVWYNDGSALPGGSVGDDDEDDEYNAKVDATYQLRKADVYFIMEHDEAHGAWLEERIKLIEAQQARMDMMEKFLHFHIVKRQPGHGAASSAHGEQQRGRRWGRQQRAQTFEDRAPNLQFALRQYQRRHGVDAITGLSANVYHQLDIEQLLSAHTYQNFGRVTLFYAGPDDDVAKALRAGCIRHRFGFRREQWFF